MADSGYCLLALWWIACVLLATSRTPEGLLELYSMIVLAAYYIFQVDVELRAQVKLFQELTGHLPHHMDGHQHVHVLPGTVQHYRAT